MEDGTAKIDLDTDWRQYSAAEQKRVIMNLIVGGLLAVGLLLIISAEALGTLCAQHWNPSAGWFPEDAHAAANTFRALGLIAFIGGVGERIILVIQGQSPPP